MSLGLGEPHPISALHGRGAGDVLDTLVTLLPEPAPVVEDDDDELDDEAEARIFSVALVGRPNVGKSTLFNRLIGEERAVVPDIPGTTRDTIDTVVETPDGPNRSVHTPRIPRTANTHEHTQY